MSDGNPWSEPFERIIRSHLPNLTDDMVLEASTDLRALGLDSLTIVALLVEVEGAFDITIPDESLVSETFENPLNLWTVVSGCRQREAPATPN